MIEFVVSLSILFAIIFTIYKYDSYTQRDKIEFDLLEDKRF